MNPKEELKKIVEGKSIKEISKVDLFEFARRAGISNLPFMSKRCILKEIKQQIGLESRRFLHRPFYYDDKSDEELIRDMYCCTIAEIKSYTKRNLFWYIAFSHALKVNHMENLFVNLRADEAVPLHNQETCGVLSRKEGFRGELYLKTNDGEVLAPADSPYYKEIKSIDQVVREEEESWAILIDERENWSKESLISGILLMGGLKKHTKGKSNEELLSLLISLEYCIFYTYVKGKSFVNRPDLRERFYKACRNLASQGFFIDPKGTNVKKGKMIREKMEESNDDNDDHSDGCAWYC